MCLPLFVCRPHPTPADQMGPHGAMTEVALRHREWDRYWLVRVANTENRPLPSYLLSGRDE